MQDRFDIDGWRAAGFRVTVRLAILFALEKLRAMQLSRRGRDGW